MSQYTLTIGGKQITTNTFNVLNPAGETVVIGYRIHGRAEHLPRSLLREPTVRR